MKKVLTAKQLISSLMEKWGYSRETAIRRIKEMVDSGDAVRIIRGVYEIYGNALNYIK